VTGAVAIISALLGIIGGFIQRHYEKEAIKERKREEIDKAIQCDPLDLSAMLDDLHDRVLEKNGSSAGQPGDNRISRE